MTFLKEIKQQPSALAELLRRYNEDKETASRFKDKLKTQNISRFIFTGMGSSNFVGYIASVLLSKKGIIAGAYEANEFACTGLNTVGKDTLVFLISQSGSSEETLELCDKINPENLSVITNNPNGPLYQYGTAKFLLYAGDEHTTATKTYTNTIASVLFICNLILECKGLEPYDFSTEINKCINIMQHLIDENSNAMTEFFADAAYICLVGGLASYCTVSHSQLVVEEAGKMYCTRYLPAQFLHGPLELIHKNFSVIAFDSSEGTRAAVDRIIDNVLAYGGKICVIGNREIKITSERLMCIKHDMENEFYAPLIEVIPVELFINDIGMKRGLNPGILTRVRK